MSTVQPLFETTTDDWEAAQAHIAAATSPAAYPLTELTAVLDADLHHLVLDPTSRTIWWAWDNAPLDGEGWTVQQITPKDAAEMAGDWVEMIQDRQDDLTEYALGHADPDRDQDVLDEYAAILVLALPAEPASAAAQIKRQRRLIARQDALQQRAYALLVSELAGTERGGKTRAGQALGITDVQVGRIIREDQQRRDALDNAIARLASELRD